MFSWTTEEGHRVYPAERGEEGLRVLRWEAVDIVITDIMMPGYRLNTFTIYVPPLRERPEDILPLAQHFLDRYAREARRPVEGFTPEAAVLLRAHAFLGNVRELRNIVERAVILCQGRRVTPEDLQIRPPALSRSSRRDDRQIAREELSGLTPHGASDRSAEINLTHVEGPSLEAIEKVAIQEALRRAGGNQAQAARLLGLSRMALHRRMRHHRLSER